MYKEFFNFSAEPFRITPDPGFLFLSDQHREALASIIYGISKRKGFVCIIGEVGVGKTTILRSYLDSVEEPDLVFVSIYNPQVSFLALLKQVFTDIGLPIPGDDVPSMVEALKHRLIEGHKRRETLVLLIDEAQNMPIGTLESLRMLSNLETATEKLVQIVLVGQPELEQLLAEQQLRQLDSRIAVRTRLGPLSAADSLAYIRHRLKCVALDDRPVFTEAALRHIVKEGQGIPRRINVICDSVLVTAFGRQQRPAGLKIVREVARDLSRGRRRVGLEIRESWRRPLGFAAGGAALTAVAIALFSLMGSEEPRRPPAAHPAPAAVAVVPPPVVQHEPPAPPKPVEAPPATVAPTAMPIQVEPLPPPPQLQVKPDAAPADPLPSIPAAEAADPFAVDIPTEALPIRRTVVAGDTLADLILKVYGTFDRRHLDWVKAHNPQIINVDRIQVGEAIVFPLMPSDRVDGP